MTKILTISLLLQSLFTGQAFAKVDLGSPKILTPPPEPTRGLDDANINTDDLLRLIEEIVSKDHPAMFERWQRYLRSQNLDPDNEDKTLKRLQQKYLESIKIWGAKISDCDSGRSSGRWLRRLRRKFGEDDVNLHKKEIAKIITSIYLKRKSECMQTHEESALRSERELYAFAIERTRLLIDFISLNSEMRISPLNKMRLLAAMKRKQSAHTLSDRSVDLNSLRLETKLQNLPKLYVDFLNHEDSFKKPFDLHKNLSYLSSEFNDSEQRPEQKVNVQPARE